MPFESEWEYALLEDGRRIGFRDQGMGVKFKCPECGEVTRSYFFAVKYPDSKTDVIVFDLAKMGERVGNRVVRDLFMGDWLKYPVRDAGSVTCPKCMGEYEPGRVKWGSKR